MTADSSFPAADAALEDEAPAIRVSHLSHRYAQPRRQRKQAAGLDRPALNDVSFEVNAREVFGILGPNGGGKTTLFRILSTLLLPRDNAGGSASIFGHDVALEPQIVRNLLGVVFQYPSLDPKLTAQENMMHQGHLYGLRGGELNRRIDRWLDAFSLADRRHDDVQNFSGGMRRRVELAKALLHRPRLLMMDEPSTGLDPGARRELWQEVLALRDEQEMTIVLTTHLMDEAEHCDHLAILSAGKLVAVDSPANLKAQIGGDVISIDANPDVPNNDPEQLAAAIRQRFGPWEDGGPAVVEMQVRFEKPNGAELVAAIAGALPGRIRRVSVGQPTLEDVFLNLTGSMLNGE